MPTTLRNTDILFNDSSTQSTAAMNAGGTIQTPSGTALTLTSTSPQTHVVQFTSAANSTINLPAANTITTKGYASYTFINRSQSNAVVFIKDNAGNALASVNVGQAMTIALLDNSTAAGVWYAFQETIDPTPILVTSASVTNNYSYAVTPVYYGGNSACALSATTYVFAQLYTATPSSTSAQVIFAAWACTVSGNTFTFGAAATTNAIGSAIGGGGLNGALVSFQLNSTTAIFHGGFSSTRYDNCCGGSSFMGGANFSVAVSVSGTTVTVGAASANNVPSYSYGVGGNFFPQGYIAGASSMPIRFPVSSTTFVTIYQSSLNQSGSASTMLAAGTGNLNCTVTTVSGVTQTNGAATTLAANNGCPIAVASHTTNAFLLVYGTASANLSTTGIRKMVTGSVSGTTVTWNTPVNIDASNVTVSRENFTQYQPVVFSSTKVAMPTYYSDTFGSYSQFSVINISGTVPSLGGVGICPSSLNIYRSSTEFLNMSNLQRYAVNSSDIIYSKQQYAYETDDGLNSSRPTGIVPPASNGNNTVLVNINYGSPAGFYTYIEKVTLPS